jgi:CDP-ribitol ribitolphosphotransferase
MQIWHSMGAIKKFGYQTLDKKAGRDFKLAKTLNMHKNYDIILSGSEAMVEYYEEAFGYNEDNFYVSNLPRIDYILKNKGNKLLKKKISKKYPKLFNKKTILYVPTFRKNHKYNYNDIIKNTDFEKFNLIIKAHPVKNQTVLSDIVYTCKGVQTIDLMLFVDYVVTDYSAISIEAAAADKKVYFYLYDYEKYIAENGVNIKLFEEYPNLSFKDANKMMNSIKKIKYDYESFQNFKDKYLDMKELNSTKKIVKTLMEENKYDKEKN